MKPNTATVTNKINPRSPVLQLNLKPMISFSEKLSLISAQPSSQKNKYKKDNSKSVQCIQCQKGEYESFNLLSHFLGLSLLMVYIVGIMVSTFTFMNWFCPTHHDICLHPLDSIVQGIQKVVIAALASIKQGLHR